MRIVISLLVAAALLTAGGVLVLSQRLETEDLRRQLIREAEAITGRDVAVEGRVDLNLLPLPTLSLAGATLGDVEASGGALRLTVDRVDLQIKALPLLRGEVEVTGVRLVRPVLHVDAAQEIARLPRLTEDGPFLPLAALGVHRLSVIDGRASFHRDEEATEASSAEFERINLELEAEDRRGPFVVSGDLRAGEHSFRLAARLGRLTADPSTTLQLEVVADAPVAGAARISYRGLVLTDGELQLRGRFALDGDDARAGLEAAAAVLGRAPPELPAWLDEPYGIGGALTTTADRADVSELLVAVGGTEAQGRMGIALAPTPVVDAVLSVGSLEVPERTPVDWSAFGLLAAASGWIDGTIDLTVGLLGYRDETVRRLRFTLDLSGEEVRIAQARALLPGNADVAFTGGLERAGGEVRLRGLLTGVTDDLAAFLGWLDLNPPGLTLAHLRTLSLSAELGLGSDSLRLHDTELRLDASSITGSLALDLQGRSRLAAALAIDRLDLDAYWPDTTPADAIAAVRQWLAHADAAIGASVDRLTWQGLRWQQVRLDGRAIDQRLSLERLSAQGIAETTAELQGEVDFAAEQLELAAELTAPRPALLLRRLGLQPPAAFGRIGSLRLDGTANGWRERTEVNLALAADGLEVGLAGELGWPEGTPAGYDIQIEATHPDYGELVDALGATWRQDRTMPGPLELTGRLRGEALRQVGLVGSASLGPTRVTGEVTWQNGAARPRVGARLSMGEPRLDTLMPILALAGSRIDPALLAGPVLGNWPKQPMAVSWLGDLDGRLELTGRGGLAGEHLELRAGLEESLLTVERLATGVFGGAMELEASLDLRRRLPYLSAALSLDDIAAQRLAGWLQLPPVLEGTAEISGEATAIGHNAFDLVRSLTGDLRVNVRDGRILGLAPEHPAEAAEVRPGISVEPAGIDIELNAAEPAVTELEELQGRFEIKRGIVEVSEAALRLDDRAGQIEGVIDLLLWATDLELLIEPGGGMDGARVKIVGPLHEPQVLRLSSDGEREAEGIGEREAEGVD